MLNGLSLFSGIGGLDVALSEWVRPIAYCEIDPCCQAVLLSRMADRSIAFAPIWDDIRTFPHKQFKKQLDIIYAGFPCQDLSVAGLRKGLEGERSGLFFEIVRLAKEIKPKFLFLENVPGILTKGGLQVVREVTEMGYDCRWCVISAASLGAPHKRERWFLLAHAKYDGSFAPSISGSSEKSIRDASEGKESTIESKGMDHTRNVATETSSDTQSHRMQKSRDQGREQERQSESLVSSLRSYWQETECPLCGVDDGVPYRLDRIKALGNAVVKSQVREAFRILSGIA
jgi:DNA (cytosine-5)-methyltransferase 1